MLASERSRRVIFENRIITFMLLGKEQNAESLLSQTEQAKNCDLEMLLQKAAEYNMSKVTQRLIQLGANVDCLTPGGNTPLTTAINHHNIETIQVLLAVNASIDVAGEYGESAKQQILYLTTNTRQFFRSTKQYATLQIFIRGVKNQKLGSVESFADKLIPAGSLLFQAAFFDDVELLECLMKRGVRVDAKDLRGMTALHGTAIAEYIRTVDWLVEKGADLNAIDAVDRSPLFIAALSYDKSMVQFLLERGANPNTEETERSPMFAVFTSACNLFYPSELSTQDIDDCLELLLQHGVASCISTKFIRTILNCVLGTGKCVERIHFVIARLAMLEMRLGETCDFVGSNEEKKKFRKYLKSCRRILIDGVFDKLSLLDLLNSSDRKMKLLERKELFVSAVEEFCSEQKLEEIHCYYYKTLLKRVSEGTDMLELEEKSITIISQIFNSNFNEIYNFGRKVVEYLNKRDLKQLCQLYE